MTIEVIGAGWGRTGTCSFKKALEILGYDRTYHMFENMDNNDQNFWMRVFEGKKYDFDEVFNRPNLVYKASCDFPSAVLWEEQLQRYPDAKVILTHRDAEKWYESCTKTIFCFAPKYPLMPFGIKILMLLLRPYGDFYGVNNYMWERASHNQFAKEEALQAYNAHVQNVIARCPPEKLLVFNVAEGWEPLCKFLDKPIPSEPFPHVNDSKEFSIIIHRSSVAGNMIVLLSISALISGVSYMYKLYSNKSTDSGMVSAM